MWPLYVTLAPRDHSKPGITEQDSLTRYEDRLNESDSVFVVRLLLGRELEARRGYVQANRGHVGPDTRLSYWILFLGSCCRI